MAEDVIKRIWFAGIIIVLFLTCIIGFVRNIGEEYGIDTSEFEGYKFNKTGQEQILNQTPEQASIYKNQSSDTSEADMSPEGASPNIIFRTAYKMWAFLTTPYRVITNVTTNVLHIPNIVINTLISLLVISIVLGAWRLIKQGD